MRVRVRVRARVRVRVRVRVAPHHAEHVVEAVARRHEALQQAVVRVVAVEEELPQLLRRQVLHLGSGKFTPGG